MSTTRKRSFVPAAFFIFSVIFSFTTCKGNVGLGGTVDITPPKIKVTSPPTAAVVRNSFTLRGTIEDDTQVDSVTVAFTDRSGRADSVFAELDHKTGTWKAVINRKDSQGQFPLKDGQQVFTVNAKDSSGKEDKTTAVVVIDNTAPFLVLNRPSSVAGGTADVFGDRFVLVGQVSDVNGAAKLDITAQPLGGGGYTNKILPERSSCD